MTVKKRTLHLAEGLDLPLDAITQKFALLGRSGSGKSYAATKLVEEMLDVGAQVVVIDIVGNWWGLRVPGEGVTIPPYPIVVLGGDHGDLELHEKMGAAVADFIVDKGVSCVLDLMHFTGGEQRRFLTAFGERFFHRKKTSRSAIHLVLEEAQEILPERTPKGEGYEALLGAFKRICKIGRAYGIGVSIITQRPAAVSKEVLNQTEVLLVGQTAGPQERKALEAWIVNAAEISRAEHKAIIDKLASLPKGTMYLWSPQWLGKFETVEIAKKKTADISATPAFVPGDSARKSIELATPDAIASVVESLRSHLYLESSAPLPGKPRGARARTQPETRGATMTLNYEALLAEKDAEIKRLREAPPRVVALDRDLIEMRAMLNGAHDLAKKIGLILEPARNPRGFIETDGHPDRPRGPAATPPTTPAPPPIAPRPRAAKPASPPADTADGSLLPRGEEVTLRAIAQHGNTGVTRPQLIVLTGYKRSTRDKFLQLLASKGLVYESGDRMLATPEGIQRLGPSFKPLPVGDELYKYWMENLPQGEARVLECVARAWPDPIMKHEIDKVTGYKRSTRDKFIQHLAARHLVTSNLSSVIANDTLFSRVP